MSRIDILTGKRANVGNSRSHSNIASKRKQEVNLQRMRIDGTNVRVSARTMKTLRKLAETAKGIRPTKRQKKAARVAARKQKTA
jgi:large subunit ribosomal protein L28